MKTLGVIGSGQMGTGIGIVASRVAGVNVKFVDPSKDSLDRCSKFVQDWCNKEIKKEKMTENDKKDILSKISFHVQTQDLKDVDFAVEVSDTIEKCKLH